MENEQQHTIRLDCTTSDPCLVLWSPEEDSERQLLTLVDKPCSHTNKDEYDYQVYKILECEDPTYTGSLTSGQDMGQATWVAVDDRLVEKHLLREWYRATMALLRCPKADRLGPAVQHGGNGQLPDPAAAARPAAAAAAGASVSTDSLHAPYSSPSVEISSSSTPRRRSARLLARAATPPTSTATAATSAPRAAARKRPAAPATDNATTKRVRATKQPRPQLSPSHSMSRRSQTRRLHDNLRPLDLVIVDPVVGNIEEQLALVVTKNVCEEFPQTQPGKVNLLFANDSRVSTIPRYRVRALPYQRRARKDDVIEEMNLRSQLFEKSRDVNIQIVPAKFKQSANELVTTLHTILGTSEDNNDSHHSSHHDDSSAGAGGAAPMNPRAVATVYPMPLRANISDDDCMQCNQFYTRYANF